MGLLPRDEAFYALFVEQSARIVESAGVFSAAFHSGSPDWDAAIQRLDEIEHAGDACMHRTIEQLAQSFITPFDPEDIHRLAITLNAVLDCLDGLSERCRIYGLTEPSESMRRLAGAIEQSAKACHAAVTALAQEKDAPDALAEMRRLEIEADKVYRTGMLALFRSETDPRTLLTQQQIYDGLEAATDRFETLSYVIEEIRLKNS